ncbi:MAG TPA: hypothetical protein VH593_12490 [Ktedonobacteraceae bacterium]|jgi:capsular polysaccharide biosynthesis protein
MAITGDENVYSTQALAISYAPLAVKDDVLSAAAPHVPGISVVQLQQAVSSAPVNGLPMIEISARSGSARQAADEANGVADAFVHLTVVRNGQDLLKQDHQIVQSLQAQRTTLDTTQNTLISLQQTHASTSAIAQQQMQLDTGQARYNALLDSYRQLQQREMQVSNELIVSRSAAVPEQFQGPNVWLNTLIALFVSLWAMFLLMIVYHQIKGTAKRVNADENQQKEQRVALLANMALPETPRPQMLTQELTARLGRVGPDTPPVVAQVQPSARTSQPLLITLPFLEKEANVSGEILRPSSFKKGLTLPSQAQHSRAYGLRQYLDSDWQLE